MACLLLPLRVSPSRAHIAHVASQRMAWLVNPATPHALPLSTLTHEVPLRNSPPIVIPDASSTPRLSSSPPTPDVPNPPNPPSPAVPKAEKPRPRLRASKAAITLAPGAISRLRGMVSGPTPQLIRIGVRNKGCAGMSYHLEYVEEPGTFDEVVEQDGAKVLIDNRALFSIIGSEMDWVEDRLSSKFVFKNPNVKDACGCGESFNV